MLRTEPLVAGPTGTAVSKRAVAKLLGATGAVALLHCRLRARLEQQATGGQEKLCDSRASNELKHAPQPQVTGLIGTTGHGWAGGAAGPGSSPAHVDVTNRQFAFKPHSMSRSTPIVGTT